MHNAATPMEDETDQPGSGNGELLTSDPEYAGCPGLMLRSGPAVAQGLTQFLAAGVRNAATRDAYARSIRRFAQWCDVRGAPDLVSITPLHVAAYIEELGQGHAAPTVKRALAAIRTAFDWLAMRGCLPNNPAAPVRGPRHVVSRGTTPVLTVEETRLLLNAIPRGSVIGLRDLALIGTMVYTFARVSAAVGMRVGDYFQQGKRWCVRLYEKGGRLHQLPAHSRLQEHMDAYLTATGFDLCHDAPLFRSADTRGRLTDRPMSRNDALRMVKRRAAEAGLSPTTCCHSFRATGITAYLSNGGLLETAQALAGHASARTTSLYDRRAETVSVGEVERINI